MARSIGTTLAVPRAALVPGGEALAFEPLGWAHLAAYLDKVENLPTGITSLSPQVASACDAVGKVVRGFGSPMRLAALLAKHPAALAGHVQPELPYAALVWSAWRLEDAANAVLAFLRKLANPGESAAARRESLRSIGAVAAAARDHPGPLLPAVASFRTAIVASNAQLDSAIGAATLVLQQEWEGVGARRARVDSLSEKIARTGVLSVHKRRELGVQLKAAEQELESLNAKAERLRIQVATLQKILREGAWLDASLGALSDFLHAARAAWSTFGAAMAQLAMDAGLDQLDPAWLHQHLDLDEAGHQWQALSSAAGRFAARAAAPAHQEVPLASYDA
jgi:hypothetical protein